jgi:hypothetical protein
MYLDDGRFLGTMVKHEVADGTYEDAEEGDQSEHDEARAPREDDPEKSIDYIAQKLSSNR